MRLPAGNAPRRLAIAVLAWLAHPAAAQYALDANPSVYSGTRNAYRDTPVMAQEIYSVNRATGTIVYNRANAFNDPTYSIYQRYTLDRFSSDRIRGVNQSSDFQRELYPRGGGSQPIAPEASPSTPGVGSNQTTVQDPIRSQNSSSGTRTTRSRSVVRPLDMYQPTSTASYRATPQVTGRSVRPTSSLSGSAYTASTPADRPRRGEPSAIRKYSVIRESDWPWLQRTRVREQ